MFEKMRQTVGFTLFVNISCFDKYFDGSRSTIRNMSKNDRDSSNCFDLMVHYDFNYKMYGLI